MTRLTRAQINRIKSIISDHMEVLMQITTGDGSPSKRLINKLKLPKSVKDLITSAYKYGKARIISDTDLTKLSTDEVNKLIDNLKLTPSQQYAIEQSKIRAQQYIDNIGQHITTGVVSTAIQSDLDMWSAVKEIVPNSMKEYTTRNKVVQQLRDTTGDMNRDWDRVAHTEMWSAKCRGEAEAIMSGESPLSKDKGDTLVYVRPAHNACAKCKALYMESNGLTPKVFTMTQLLNNGSNYGKKQADWLPTVPPLHPNCMCTLNIMPKDTAFDDSGNLVFSPKGKK